MFSHSLISVCLLGEWVTHLLIPSSNIYQRLICVSHVKGNVEMSKSGIPGNSCLRERLWPGCCQDAGSPAFSVSVQALPPRARKGFHQSSPCLWVHSPPGAGAAHWHWRVPVTKIRDFPVRKQLGGTFALGLLQIGLMQGTNGWAPPGRESLEGSLEAGALSPNHTTTCASLDTLSPIVFEPSVLRGLLAPRQPLQTIQEAKSLIQLQRLRACLVISLA